MHSLENISFSKVSLVGRQAGHSYSGSSVFFFLETTSLRASRSAGNDVINVEKGVWDAHKRKFVFGCRVAEWSGEPVSSCDRAGWRV